MNLKEKGLAALQQEVRDRFKVEFGWMETMPAGAEISKKDVDDLAEFLDLIVVEVAERVKDAVVPEFEDDPECEHGFMPSSDCPNTECSKRANRNIREEMLSRFTTFMGKDL